MGVVTTLGYALNMIPFVKRHEDRDDVPDGAADLPAGCGPVGTIAVVIKKKYCSA